MNSALRSHLVHVALGAVLLTFGGAAAPAQPFNPLQSRAKEKQALIEKLKRDIFKVDRSILETEKLIARSRNAPYLPDLQFRLAELYVEKSRYVYYLAAEQRPEGMKGAMVSPETRLLKEKAVQLYRRLLREHPEFHDGDKVTFYLAHEMRELGQFDEMLKILGELSRRYPQSPLRLEAQQILGDYFFDKADLTQAEKHFGAVLDAPPSPVHDLARYKMGWIRINQGKHPEAVTFFEAAAASAPVPGVDPSKALNVKREALLDLVYSYTEARPAKGALNYFEKLSDSRATYALALEKLGTRYFIKQQYEYAIPALRRLMEIQSDPELDLERAQRLYDALKASRGKVSAEPEDVRYLVRAAVTVKGDPLKDEAERKTQLGELEEMARDLATGLHQSAVAATKRKEDPALFARSADAYEEYLALFRPAGLVKTIHRNRADALFAAKKFPDAAREFEVLARLLDPSRAATEDTAGPDAVAAAEGPRDKPKDKKAPAKRGKATLSEEDAGTHEQALYGALLAHFSGLRAENVTKLDAFEVADARQALKLLGAEYVSLYPKSDKAVEVKFNIARAYYDDGEFEQGAKLFEAFALSHPSHKDAVVAGHLALDAHRQRYDFKALEETGKKLLSAPLPSGFLAEVKGILEQSRSEALGELALRSSTETGDVVEGLTKVADENKGGEIGEKALYGAFGAAGEKRDFTRQAELGQRFVNEYPKSEFVTPVLLTLGRQAAEVGRFAEAAGYYEQLGQRLHPDGAALDGWMAAARLRLALEDTPGAVRALEKGMEVAGGRKSELLTLISQAHLKAKALPSARAAAEQALKLDSQNAEAGAVLAEVHARSGTQDSPDALVATIGAIAQGPQGQTEDTAKAIWFVAELFYRSFKALPAEEVEQKVELVQQLEGLYTQVASIGSPEYAVASLWRLGLAYGHLAEVVEGSPLPDGLSPAEVQQFRQAVKEQVAPIKQRADAVLKACVSRAGSLEVFTEATIGCRARTDQVKPVVVREPARPLGPEVEALLKQAELAQSAEALEALGLAHLAARRLPEAQLALGRATELDEGRASAHSALGLALLLAGDAMGAREAYGRALDADPTHPGARANLATLRCRFGDSDGARRELAVVKDPGALAGPAVDPEWRTCR